MRGTKCWTDHRLIRAVLKLHISPAQRKHPKTVRAAFDIAKLKKDILCKRFQDTLDAIIQNATLTEDITEKWDQFKNIVNEIKKSVLGPKQYVRTGSTMTNKSHSFFGRKTTPSSLGRTTIARRPIRSVQAHEKAGTEKVAGDERYLVGQESRSADVC